MLECTDDRFGGEHAGFHRGVNALDALAVEERGAVADKQDAVRVKSAASCNNRLR